MPSFDTVRGLSYPEWALLVLLGLAPLWYGSVLPAAWVANGLAAAVTAMAVIATGAWRGTGPAIAPSRYALMAALYAIAAAWVLLQALPIAPDWLQHPLWREASGALGYPLRGTISANPELTLQALLRLLTFATVFWISMELCRRAEFAIVLLYALAAFAVLNSIYALADMAFGWQRVLFAAKDPFVIAVHGNYASGTFINRNHFAAYVGTGLIAASALFLRAVLRGETSGKGNRKRKTARIISRLITDGAPILVLALPIAIALIVTTSRAGIATTFAGLLVLCMLIAARSSNRVVVLVMSAMLVVASFVVLDLHGEAALRRAADASGALHGRLAAYKATVVAAFDHPVLGHGYGAFIDFFPSYRSAEMGLGGIWNAAHNTYLEVFAGLGLPVALILLSAVLIATMRCFLGALGRKRSAWGPLVAAAATVQLGLHSLVEFPLQTEAVALNLAALLGAGTAQSWSSRRLAEFD